MKGEEKKLELKDPKIQQTNENCQVFNGPISGCVFAMPGSTVNQSPVQKVDANVTEKHNNPSLTSGQRNEELFHFVHPELDEEEAWRIHDAVKRVVKRQGVQMICLYLSQLKKDNKVLLPPNPSAAYAELVRMGMPDGEGFNEATFRKYYNKPIAPNAK